MVDLADIGRHLVQHPPIDPTPLDQLRRRWRRRQIRRFSATAVALVAAGSALAVTITGHTGSRAEKVQTLTTSPTSTVPPLVPESIPNVITPSGGAVNMAATGPGSAWADNGLGFYVTTNWGARWLDSTPPVLAGGDVVADIFDVAAAGTDRMWIAWVNHHSGGPTRVSRTVDAGRTWLTTELPGQPSTGYSEVHLNFLNADDGWAVGAGQPNPILLRSTDGGASWRTVATAPVVGPLTFTDSDHGWIASLDESNPGLWRTVDGGLTWKRVELPVPPALQIPGQHPPVLNGLPTFFDHERGVLAASFHLGVAVSGPIVIYDTSDGGATWSPHLTPADPNTRRYVPYRVPFSAPAPDRWFLYVGPYLYTSGDGGRVWNRVTPSPQWSDIEGLDFVTPQQGWALVIDQTCTAPAGSPAANYCTYAVLVTTDDAGLHWTPTDFPDPSTTSVTPP